MRILKLFLVLPLIAIMLSASPAFAGKDKTLSEWGSQMNTIRSSVTDKAALAKAKMLNKSMEDGHANMNRSKYYKLASKTFKELKELSKQNGGDTIYTPSWID